MHDGDRRGFNAFRAVVKRLKGRDPRGENTRWRTCSEITNYACAMKMAAIGVDGNSATIELPLQVPETTVRIDTPGIKTVAIDGDPLRRVHAKSFFEDGTFWGSDDKTYAAFTPTGRSVALTVETSTDRP